MPQMETGPATTRQPLAPSAVHAVCCRLGSPRWQFDVRKLDYDGWHHNGHDRVRPMYTCAGPSAVREDPLNDCRTETHEARAAKPIAPG
jgi:hypothetical protein